MAKKHRPYAPEFRRQMIELVRAGRGPEELAKEFEPSAQAIRNWFAQADRDEGRRADGLTTAEREELNHLRREIRQLKLEREILGFRKINLETRCSIGAFRRGVRRADFRGQRGVHQGTRRGRPLHPRVIAAGGDAQDAAHHGDGVTGPVLAHELEPFGGITSVSRANQAAAFERRVSRKRVARLMLNAGLVGVSRRKSAVTTVRDGARQAPDLVDRNFTADQPNRLWVADNSNVGRLPLSGGCARCVQPPDRRLVDGDHLAHAGGARRPQHGALAAAAERRDPPFGSWLAVYLDRVRQTMSRGRRSPLDGVGRRRLRQRDGREFLRHARM